MTARLVAEKGAHDDHPDGGPEVTNVDLGQELLWAFGRSGCYPYVPDWAIDELHVTAPMTFATWEVEPRAAYLFESVPELLNSSCSRRFAVTYDGHGINSYAWTVRLERPGLRVLAQCGFGGALADPAEDDRTLRALFDQVRRLDERVPEADDQDIVVLLSDIRGIQSVGPAAPGVHPRTWEEAHSVDDVDGAVESLLVSGPTDPWDRLEQHVAHALRQSLYGQQSYELLSDDRFLVVVDVENERSVVRLITDDAEDGQVGPDPGMRRLGWDVTPDLPNMHLVVTGEEDVDAVASALAATAYFIWHLDPVIAAERLAKVVGGDDNGGEWD